MEAAFGRKGIQVLFDAAVVFTDDVLKLDDLGVWGVRNTSRLRRLLRQRGVAVAIARELPPQAKLRYYSTGTAKRRHRQAMP